MVTSRGICCLIVLVWPAKTQQTLQLRLYKDDYGFMMWKCFILKQNVPSYGSFYFVSVTVVFSEPFNTFSRYEVGITIKQRALLSNFKLLRILVYMSSVVVLADHKATSKGRSWNLCA